MKKILFISLLFFPLLSSGQQFKFGFNCNLLFWHGIAPENEGQVELPDWVYKEHHYLLFNWQANGSYHYPVLKFNDDKMSLGINANAAFGYLRTQDLDLDGVFTLDFPEYIMFRYGSGATKNTDAAVGFGLGVGYTYEVMPIALGTPIVCGELTFRSGFALRIGTDILKRTLWGYYSSEGLKPELTYREVILQFSVKL